MGGVFLQHSLNYFCLCGIFILLNFSMEKRHSRRKISYHKFLFLSRDQQDGRPDRARGGGRGRRGGTSALRACAHGLEVPRLILGPPRTKSWQYRHVRRLWRRGLCLRTSPVDPYGCMLCTVLKPVIVGATQSSRCLGFLARPVSERAMPRTRPVPLRAMTREWPVSCLCVERPGPREQPVSVRAMQRERPVPMRALPRAHRIGPNVHISALACCDFARGSCACWNLIHTNH